LKATVWVAIAATSLVLGCLTGWYVPCPNDLIFLNVGQGDCAVLRDRGITLLIDDGPLKRTETSESAAVLPALRRHSIGNVDLILLSHPDMDHIGGTRAILERFPNAKVAISAEFETQPKLIHEMTQWNKASERVLWLPEEATVRVGDCVLNVVCPPVTDRENDNRGSMFVRIQDQGATADFSGDAPSDIEDQIVSRGTWPADILHVGHHGSRTSTGERWIEAVHPSFAVISCGRDNPYGHPHRATLDRLTAHKIAVERTDLDGDLSFVPSRGHFVPAP
jgi:competence protein ComEC